MLYTMKILAVVIPIWEQWVSKDYVIVWLHLYEVYDCGYRWRLDNGSAFGPQRCSFTWTTFLVRRWATPWKWLRLWNVFKDEGRSPSSTLFVPQVRHRHQRAVTGLTP